MFIEGTTDIVVRSQWLGEGVRPPYGGPGVDQRGIQHQGSSCHCDQVNVDAAYLLEVRTGQARTSGWTEHVYHA